MNYDNVFLDLCSVRCANAEAEFSQNKHFDADLLFSEAYVGTAIDKLNNRNRRMNTACPLSILNQQNPLQFLCLLGFLMKF